ncbi:MAG: hypothetical protein EBZ48_04830 [Proteobacteria bacterium]|nr:hypothetical protein [Pseudomonadota bacterium]
MQRLLALILLVFAVMFLVRQLRSLIRGISDPQTRGGCGGGGCGCQKKPDIEVEVIKRTE